MDPLVLYTIKRTIATRCDKANPIVSATPTVTDTSKFAIPTEIFKVEAWPLLPGDRVPKLERGNILSLVFHADEQWLESVRQSDASNPKTIDAIHLQQQIFLNTLYILHKSVSPNNSSRQFPEAVWFACQVLYHGYQVKYLESMTSTLAPPAHMLYKAMREVRQQVCVQAVKQHCKSNVDDALIATLDHFVVAWEQLEDVLYKSYGKAILGIADNDTLFVSKKDNAQRQQHACFLPPELFSDSFTQLLPMTLDRALSQPRHRRLITRSMLEDLDPAAFIAVPRLTILAGMTWLSDVSGWRRVGRGEHHPRNPWVSQTLEQRTSFDRLRHSIERLEAVLSPQEFLECYTQLETTLVQGQTTEAAEAAAAAVATSKDNHDAAEIAACVTSIYQATCVVADTLLTSAPVQSFTVVLRSLLAYFTPSPPSVGTSTNVSPSALAESVVLDLAI